MPPHLRAFLFDSSQPSNDLVENVFSSWEKGIGVAIISTNQPRVLVDKAIVRCDPNEVVDLSTGETTTRELAIVETPDLAAVVLTSGTTADPKPVELSFRAMHNSVDAFYESTGLDSNTTWLCCLPPQYIGGLAIFARCFVKQSRLSFHQTFDVDRIAQSLVHDDIGAVSLVSSQLKQLLSADVNLSNLSTVLLGGSAIDAEVIRQCNDRDIPIHRTYGMTETWGGICHDGKLFSNTKVRINEDGIVELSSSSLMSGYRHNYPATIARITSDGWFITNDRGSFEKDELTIFGRADDVINSGGIKVDPEPVERLLRASFPDHSAWICATPHETYGQSVTACFLESNSLPTLQEIRASLSHDLPSTQLPIRLATIPSEPLTESGKIRRSELATMCTISEEHKKGSS